MMYVYTVMYVYQLKRIAEQCDVETCRHPADPHKIVMSGEIGGNGEDVEKRYFKCSLKRAAGCDAKAQAVSFYLDGDRKVRQMRVYCHI